MRGALACIVIDDATLTRRYGFINVRKFVAWVKAEELAATFAFIPWNWRRTDPSIAELFSNDPERLSLCVHGCNHLRAEFASADKLYLHEICALARYRMMEHECASGLPWDNVMVFPQGEFSREAMQALRDTGYTAAVNSMNPCLERALSGPFIADFGLPLLTRRYPKNISDFVSDVEAGRPALIVQHHWDLADGLGPITAFVKRLRDEIPTLQWRPLGTIIAQLALKPAHISIAEAVRQSRWIRARAASRRRLCDFRDNWLQPALHVLRHRLAG